MDESPYNILGERLARYHSVRETSAGDGYETGFQKLTPMINSMKQYEIEQRESPKGRFKLIYVRNKEER